MLEARLVAETDAAIEGTWTATPAAWGVSDCALAVMDIYRIRLGRDPAHAYRGRYASGRGARRVLPRGGLAAAVRAVAREQGWPAIDPADARPGDLGLVRTPRGPACAIRHRRWWVHRIDFGFATFVDAQVRLAWRVG